MKIFGLKSFFATTGLLCLSAPVFAGEWSISYEAEGLHSRSGDAPVPWESDDAVQGLPGEFFGDEQIHLSPHSSGEIGLSGWVSAVLTWIPNGPNDNPPEKVSLLVQSRVQASWNINLVPPI